MAKNAGTPIFSPSQRVESDQSTGRLFGIRNRFCAAPPKQFSYVVRGRFRQMDQALVPTSEVEKSGLWAIRGRRPVRAAEQSRAHLSVVAGKLRILRRNRPAVRIYAVGPSNIDERLRKQKFAVLPIQHIIEAVAISLYQKLAPLPAQFSIQKHWDDRRVVVINVVRSKLKVPAKLSRVSVECDDGIAVQVVPFPIPTIEIRAGIANSPID